MDLYIEEDFYKDNGWPPEEYHYCDFVLPIDSETEYGRDYDQFILVVNSLNPYLRLSKKRYNSQWPCGLSTSPSINGWFASMPDEERDDKCPKMAWGIAAWYMAYLSYSSKQKDYVLQKEQNIVFKEYYDRFWNIYKSNHSGLKYSKISIEQKELHFIAEHLDNERKFWDQSTKLKDYPDLFNYAKDAKDDYLSFLLQRQQILEENMNPNNYYSTEINSSPSGPYIRVFFLEDSDAIRAKSVVEAVNSVRKVNMGESKSTSHPGNYLIVYLKPMVTGDYADKEIKEALNAFFSGLPQASTARKVKTDAYFDNIEQQVINDLKGARVSIHVAMAWFTNQRIADVLIEKFKEGLDVKVVSFDDHTNARFGVNLDGIPHKLVKVPSGGIMHDKFCVIDNQKVLTGSYNWSMKAENKNIENVPVIYDDARASDYSVEFRILFDL